MTQNTHTPEGEITVEDGGGGRGGAGTEEAILYDSSQVNYIVKVAQ